MQILKTLPGDTNFHLIENLVQNLYPSHIAKLKLSEGINSSFLLSAYIVLKENMPIACCCLYDNPHLKFKNFKTFCVGNFESINDTNACSLLIGTVIKEAKANDGKYLIGPMNGSTWDTYRIGKDYSGANFFLEPYYKDYYTLLFENNGFQKIARYTTNIDEEKNLNTERIEKIEARFSKQKITVRNLNLDNYEEDLDKLYAFCMVAFKNNFLFTPIPKQEFINKYLKLKPYIDAQYVLIAENEQKEVLGFIFCLQNFYDTQKKGLIIKTIAKNNSIRYGGMGNVLATLVKKRALYNGYQYMLHAFMIETNASNNLSHYFSGNTIKEYYLYGKEIY